MSSQALSEASGALLQFIRGQRQNARLLKLHFPREDGPSALMVANRLDATEGLSRDFHFVVEVLSDQPDIALKDVLGKMVSIELLRDDGSSRFFNGHVFEFRFVKNEGGFAFYDMVLLPWLAFLRLTRNNRLFHFKTVEQQSAQLLGECPHADWRSQQLGSDPVMTDACQFDESNYNYLHRRWEALGWHYWYEHSKAGHTLVISGDSTACEPLDGGAAVPWKGDAGVREPGVQGLTPVRNVASTTFSASSFDFKRPRPQMADTPTLNQQGDIPPLEVYEYAGAYGYADAGAGRDYVRRRMEEIEAAAKHFVAVSDYRGMQPGRYFQLTGHVMSEAFGMVDDGDDTSFLVLEVRHSASNNFETQQGQVSHYQAQLSCLRKKVPWRPGRSHNSIEPKIYGLQTAIVVGPAGEEIHTDEYGRVRVQFHWDREGTFDDKSSAWVRVASTWAGSNFGFVAIPRIGQEVLVQFLDGNPDRPLITGRVYNQDNMPPWELPANKTQTGMLSRSSKGGGYENANAIRFEDKKGQEEVWLHAEKDQRIEVEHDESHWVGHDRSKTIDHDETVHVKHDRTETVDHDETITVHNDRKERVDHNETISVGDNRTEDVGQNETITVGQNQTVSIGSNRSVKVGGSKTETVKLTKAETIGLAKALTVGGAYQTTVGGLMNTTVALQQMEQVGLNKSSKVGKNYRLEAGDKIELVCGESRIVLTPKAIYLDSPEVHVKAAGHVHVDGPSDILLNSGTAQAAPKSEDEAPPKTDGAALAGMAGMAAGVMGALGSLGGGAALASSAAASGEASKPKGAAAGAAGAAGAGGGPRRAATPPPAQAKNLLPPRTPAEAPAELNLSSMQGGFDEQWGKSLPGTTSLEHGGTLVADASGKLSMVNTGSGTDGTFAPNLDVAAGQQVQGIFHTHPYSAAEGGYTGVSLSGGDAAYMINEKQNVIIAQSGSEQFMYLRTQATPATVDYDALNDGQNARMMELVNAGKSFSEASKVAAQETAVSHGLAYYSGTGGVFRRVSP